MPNSIVLLTLFTLDRKTVLGQISSKNSKLFLQDETWCVEKFKYSEFSSEVHLSCFGREIPFLGKI